MNLKKYFKVYTKFFHTSIASEFEYKTNILIDLPANILSGNETNISGGLCMQILWIFLLFPLFKKIWSEGTKKYTAMGS